MVNRRPPSTFANAASTPNWCHSPSRSQATPSGRDDKTELLLAIISDGVDARQGLVVDEGLSAEHPSLDSMISAGCQRFFESFDNDPTTVGERTERP